MPIIPSFTLGGDDLTHVIPEQPPHARQNIWPRRARWCTTLHLHAALGFLGYFLQKTSRPRKGWKKLNNKKNEILKGWEKKVRMKPCRSVTDLRFKGVGGLGWARYISSKLERKSVFIYLFIYLFCEWSKRSRCFGGDLHLPSLIFKNAKLCRGLQRV